MKNLREGEEPMLSTMFPERLAEWWNKDDQLGLSIPLLKRRPSQKHPRGLKHDGLSIGTKNHMSFKQVGGP